MPKREDEYWAGMKEPKGRGLCPFCGSSNVYYNKHYKRWRCGSCEKSFPSPSYGSGGDFGKEARWFGKTTEKTRRKEFAEVARKKRATSWKKSPMGGFTARKAFLIFLLIACLVALIYTSYLLFTHRTDPVIGTIILVADIGVLIWNISVLRKWRVRARTIVAIAVVIAVLGATTGAFAGIQPFSTAKNELVTWFQKAPSQPSEQLPPPAELPFPTALEYPADISGYVTIAETVKAKYQSGSHSGETMDMTPLEGKIYWIVDISVKNKTYESEITANYNHWKIVVDDKVYDAQSPFMSIQSAYPMTVPVGQTGQTTIRFPVPDTLKVSSAKLCYQGQEPYSYGNLSGGDRVAVYDWDLRTVITEPEAVAEAENWKIQLDGKSWEGSTVTVKVTITNLDSRRDFGFFNPKLVAIDYTGKVIEPWVPKPFDLPPYAREFYPNESWSGSLKFEMSPYSGETKLYMTSEYVFPYYFLFELGSPTKD